MANLIRWGERLFLIPLSIGVILRVWPQLPTHLTGVLKRQLFEVKISSIRASLAPISRSFSFS